MKLPACYAAGGMFVLLPIASALAQEPQPADESSPARLCADAASGSEVEVCLRLAATYPDEVDGVAAALRGHIDRRSADDRDILQALLLLLTTETGEEGARQLGALADPRAIQPLVHATQNRELAVALASLEALSRYEEALEPLSAFLLDETLTIDVRVAAARALGAMGTEDAGDVLLTTLRRRNIPPPLRQAMIRTVEEAFPHRTGELDRQVSTDGSLWLAAGGAWGLGYALYATGSFGQADMSQLGAGSGGLAGGTAGFLVGRAWPMEAGDAAFVTTTGVGGTVAGTLVFAGLQQEPTLGDSARAGGLIGEAGGYALGIMLREAHPGSATDAVEAAAIGTTAALAAGALVGTADDGAPQLAAGLGLVAGLSVGHAVAPRITLQPVDASLIVVLAGYGAGAGYVLGGNASGPLRLEPEMIAGGALGALGGYAVAGAFDPPPDTMIGGTIGLVYGGAMGAGTALVVQDIRGKPANPWPATITGATVGLGVGAFWAYRDDQPIEASDAMVIGLASGWATWQAGGLGTLLAGEPSTGWLIVVPAAAGGAAALSTPYLDIPVTHALAATSLGLWGGYVAGVGAQVGDRDVLLYAIVGSDVGLGLGAVAMSPLLNTPTLVIGLADAGGVLGGSLAAMGTSFVTEDPDAILIASLAGAGVGFTGGGIAGWMLQGSTRDVARLDLRLDPGVRWTLVPASFPDGDRVAYGARIGVQGW